MEHKFTGESAKIMVTGQAKVSGMGRHMHFYGGKFVDLTYAPKGDGTGFCSKCNSISGLRGACCIRKRTVTVTGVLAQNGLFFLRNQTMNLEHRIW